MSRIGQDLFLNRCTRFFNLRHLKILWVNPAPLDVFLHNTALLNALNQLAELGHDVNLVSVRSRRHFKAKKPQMHMLLVPLRFVPFISSIMFSVILFFYLPVYVAISKPDFIIMIPDISIISSIPAFLVSKFSKTRLILDVRSIPVETVGFRGTLHKFWFNLSFSVEKKFFDGVTILTSLMKKEVCTSFSVEPDKVGVWTSGVSYDLFNPENFFEMKLELKKKLGLSDKFVIFYHGIFTPTRGLAETINGLQILISKYPDLIFFLLGSGPFASDLSVLIQKQSLQKNVILANPVIHSEVPKFIAMCDVAIVPLPDHPYWRFQSPLKLLEYMAMEKVVILTDIPAHREIIGKAKCGIFISSIDSMEIARAIEFAYLNNESLEYWGKIGRELVEQKYTWEKVVKDLEKYLYSLMN